MPETELNSAIASDLTNAMTDYSVDTQQTDAGGEQKRTTWMNANWSQQFGYYTTIPECTSVIDAKGTWTVGKGFKADPETTMILNSLIGFGKDTFNTILENMIRTYHIGGDAYCEIVRDKKKEIINLKPLDPGVIVHVVDQQGMIESYEQNSKVKGNPPKKFKKEQIFHLVKNRVADQIHGTGIVDRLAEIILMKNQAMNDWKRVLHRNIDPMMIFHLDEDDPTKIATFKAKVDAARGKGENMYIPKGAVEPEQMSLATNAALNPIAWIEMLDDKFYEAAQVPKIIVGGVGGITEAAVKIAYLAFQQTIEEEQLFIKEQIGMQLGMQVDLEFPASLENELLSDNRKDGAQNIDASETTAGAGQ